MCKRVAILPTGRMEWHALPQALSALFPKHHFYSLPTQAEVSSHPIEFPVPSFTSVDVTKLAGKANNADKLIERAAAEAIGDRNNTPADMVVIIDDLELANLHQPVSVIEIITEAAQRFLDKFDYERRRQMRYREALQNRVSFHLAKPMIESWLFADPERLAQTCGVARTICLLQNTNPEYFETNDPEYDADDGTQCDCWANIPANRKKPKDGPAWLKNAVGPKRQLHPKAYLSWLCFAPKEKTCTNYSETGSGANALRNLNWNALFQNPNHALFCRSLIHDIAHALNEEPPFPGLQRTETQFAACRNCVLRNV